MTSDNRPVQINMSSIPVAGIGGLGLVAMAVLVSSVMPELRWTMAAGVAGGLVLAVGLVVFRRVRRPAGPNGNDPAILFREVSAEDGRRDADRPHRPMIRALDRPIYSTR